MPSWLRPVFLVFKVIFALFLSYFALRLLHYHFSLTTFPYPSALREGAMMTSTDALIKGINPYAMSLQPRLMNEYGIMYPLLVWPLAKIFGPTILVHRMVTAFSILACCVLVFFVLKKMSIALLLNIWAVLMLYASLLYPGTSTASIDPGGTGTFFFLLTLFVPWLCRYSNKSLVASALFGILAFYTKLYTFLGALILISYLFLFISKRKSLYFGLILFIPLSFTIGIVNQILPAYFDNCFFSEVNMAPAWASVERLHMQMAMYKTLHFWIFILMGALMLLWSLRAIVNFTQDKELQAKGVVHALRTAAGKLWPLTKTGFPLVLYAALCSGSVIYFSMGRNTGATLWYFFQLLSPFILIGAAWVFNRFTYWPLLCVPLLILNLYTITKNENYTIFDNSAVVWSKLTEIITEHQHILNSPLIAPLLIEQNKDIVDAGQAEYFALGGRRDYWMKGWLKEDDRIFIQLMLYFNNIRVMVENKAYDLIIIQPSLMPLGVGDDVKKFYKYEGDLLLYAPQDGRPYELTIWKPL